MANSRQTEISLIGQIVQRVSAAFTLLGLLTTAIISIVSGNIQDHAGYVSAINIIGIGLMAIGILSGLVSSVIISLVLSKTDK